MNKYLLLYRNPVAYATQQASQEEMNAMFAQWGAWKTKFKDNIADLGDGLKPSGRVLKSGVVTDGPHIEAKEVLAGYSVVQAKTYEEAVEVARACPINAMPGAYTEIREMKGF